MDSTVELCICILCTDFANTVIWESWRSDDENHVDERRIGFVTHPRPEHAWFVPFAVNRPLETKWGDVSLVDAEVRMLTESLQRFPAVKHLLIISGDTVPIRPKEDFLQFFIDDDNHRTSTVVLHNDVRPVNPCDPLLTRLGLRVLYNGHQFIALSRAHAEFLTSPVGVAKLRHMERLQYDTPGYVGQFRPDEVFLQTILANNIGFRCGTRIWAPGEKNQWGT